MDFQVAAIKPQIDTADFNKLDIRAGTILSIQEIPGAERLMKLTVSVGDRERVILAGIRHEREDPRQLEGKQALFVVNLKPRRMMGHVSEGMLLDVGYTDGLTPVLAIPESSVPDGARAG